MNCFYYFNGKKKLYITYLQRKTLFKNEIIQIIENMFSKLEVLILWYWKILGVVLLNNENILSYDGINIRIVIYKP